MEENKKTRNGANWVFWCFLGFYLIVNGVLVWMCARPKSLLIRPWLSESFMAGLIVGGLFVLIAIYYFYNNYLSPYLEEEIKPTDEYRKPHMYVLMLRWFIPPLILQLFVVMGFLITIYFSPLRGNVYVQPYKYGQIYKQIEDFNSSELTLRVSTKKDLPQLLERKKELLENAARYFKGQVVEENRRELITYMIPYLIALAFSFLGALVYALWDAVHRLHTSDLYPKTYLSYLIRFIFALSLSITIAYFLMNDWWINAAPILFFLIGFFPQRALQYVEEKAMVLLRLRKEQKEEISLGLVQGMTDYKIYRFREIGVGDAQNLANIDLTYLHDNLAYNYRLLCDFVSQAMLLIYLKDHIGVLRAFGIRDILSFKSIVNRQNYREIATLLNLPSEKLVGLLKVIESEPVNSRVETILACINRSTKDERKGIGEQKGGS